MGRANAWFIFFHIKLYAAKTSCSELISFQFEASDLEFTIRWKMRINEMSVLQSASRTEVSPIIIYYLAIFSSNQKLFF